MSEYVLCPDEPQPLYDLYAISNHFGGMGGGHCKLASSLLCVLTDFVLHFCVDTAFAKNHESGKWFNFDDSHVSQTSEDRLVVHANNTIVILLDFLSCYLYVFCCVHTTDCLSLCAVLSSPNGGETCET